MKNILKSEGLSSSSNADIYPRSQIPGELELSAGPACSLDVLSALRSLPGVKTPPGSPGETQSADHLCQTFTHRPSPA